MFVAEINISQWKLIKFKSSTQDWILFCIKNYLEGAS